MSFRSFLLLTGAVLTLVAFVAPGAAEAHCLTEEGECIETGSGVTITSTNLVSLTALGTTTCGKVTLHYTAVTNTNEHLVLEPVNVGGVATTNETTESCVLHTGGGRPIHVVDINAAGTDTTTFNTWGTAEALTKVTAKTTFSGGGSVTCTLGGSLHLQLTNGTSNMTMGPSTMNGGLCGSMVSEGSGTLETSGGTSLIVDSERT